VIAELMKVAGALRAGWSAGRAVMDGRSPVLVDEVLAAEGCECPNPRVVVVHNRGTRCGTEQHVTAAEVLKGRCAYPDDAARAVLDALAHEADRRDGVRRGPR
jgi:hypothetical protein